MKRKKIIGFFALLLFVLPLNTKATGDCDLQTFAKYRQLAANVNISYTYKETDKDAIFNVKISNVYPGLRIENATTNEKYKTNSSSETPYVIDIPNLKSGTSYQYNVYTNSNSCGTSRLLKVYYVTLPSYNPYYKDPLCVNNPDFRLCQKWVKHSASYDELKKEISNYEQSKQVEEDNQISKNNPLLSFIRDYYYIVLIIIIGSCLYVIYIKKKNDTFGF